MSRDIAAERSDYEGDRLREGEAPDDPYLLFARWLSDAFAARDLGTVSEPTAMVVSTAGQDDTGNFRPSSRSVLLKGVDSGGFVFFTNYDSRKGHELAANPWAALHFGWYSLYRQVRIEGTVSRVHRAESETYFATRPRGSQLGAWASRQSSVVGSLQELVASYTAAEQRYAGSEVPCPPHWGGFRVRPEMIEFWQGQPSRMHDRLVYRQSAVTGDWSLSRLAP